MKYMISPDIRNTSLHTGKNSKNFMREKVSGLGGMIYKISTDNQYK